MYTKKGSPRKGFTLIELMVIVAIMAIVTAIIVTVVGGARNSGADGGIKANLNAVRSQAELFYLSNGNKYALINGIYNPPFCQNVAQSDTNGYMMIRDKKIYAAIKEAIRLTGATNSAVTPVARCPNSKTHWAVAVRLKSSASKSWCIDSSGASRVVNSIPVVAYTVNNTTGVIVCQP